MDTVKTLDDKCLYDISFNDSIQHLRHALALNEDRTWFDPESLYPVYKNLGERRTFVQAWFVGTHINIGGSAAKDGLALYPLQWVLAESRDKGLVLEFDASLAKPVKIDNPLELIFPSSKYSGQQIDMVSYRTKNNINVEMQDIREIHESERYRMRYAIHVERSGHWSRDSRAPFTTKGDLKGYHEYGVSHSPLCS